jgi:hypothetical protein
MNCQRYCRTWEARVNVGTDTASYVHRQRAGPLLKVASGYYSSSLSVVASSMLFDPGTGGTAGEMGWRASVKSVT